jgi:hypothetical protein
LPEDRGATRGSKRDDAAGEEAANEDDAEGTASEGDHTAKGSRSLSCASSSASGSSAAGMPLRLLLLWLAKGSAFAEEGHMTECATTPSVECVCVHGESDIG